MKDRFNRLRERMGGSGPRVIKRRPPAILIAMATHRTPVPEAIVNLRKAVVHFDSLQTGIEIRETLAIGCLMHISHAKAVTYAMSEPEVEAVLFWDDDTAVTILEDFNPILRLWTQDKDVIGGLYTNRSRPIELQAGNVNAQGVMQRVTLAEAEGLLQAGEPFRRDFVGSGFLMVRRRALERMVERVCPVEKLFQAETAWRHLPGVDSRLRDAITKTAFHEGEAAGLDDNVDALKDEMDRIWRESQQLGTDLSFCKKAREAGCEVWVDPSFEVGHIGNYAYRVRDWLAQELDRREQQQEASNA